jgi:pSer/pThr/pTyr-binding forkhead associated (FHA) protein/predicted  nucleic acid-binding Zn-ribbon protein
MEYWCAEQLVVTVEGPSGRSVLSLAQPFARVGSHPASEVVLADPAVPLRSVYLHATPQGVFCLYLDCQQQDLDNRGTWLHPDQELALGPFRLKAGLLTAEPGDAVPERSLAAWGSSPPPLPVMMVYCGPTLKDKRRFRARLNPVGRRPQCGLQLKGQKVSAFHCVLYWEHEHLWCIDLNSSNGTFLNEQPLVCGRVAIGDRLEVGEFGLVFQRLSRGRKRAAESSASEESGESASSLPTPAEGRVETTGPTLKVQAIDQTQRTRWRQPPARSGGEPSAPALPLAAESASQEAKSTPEPGRVPLAAGPLDEQQRTERDKLAAEVARLSSERQEMQARWEQTSQQFQAQIGQLHGEASRLAEQRQALQQSRDDWHSERAALTQQLHERSEQLVRLEAELKAATASLSQKLAEIDKQAHQPLPAPPEAQREIIANDLLAAELAPTTIVEGIAPDLAPELVQQVVPEVDWNYHAPVPHEKPAGLSPQEQLQAQWEATSQRLTVQIEQLQTESAELAAQRRDLEDSRHQWQAERAALAEQLGARAEQLTRLEAELAATRLSLAKQLAEVEQRAQQQAQRGDSPSQHPAAHPLDDLLLEQLAPTAMVAGLEPNAAASLIPPITSEVTWTYVAQDPGAEFAPPPNPEEQLQSQWAEATQQLTAQIEQLRAEAAELAAERQALQQSRHEWQAERESLSHQLADRQAQLARLEADLATMTSALAGKLADVEQRMQHAASAALERAAEGAPAGPGRRPLAAAEVASPPPLDSPPDSAPSPAWVTDSEPAGGEEQLGQPLDASRSDDEESGEAAPLATAEVEQKQVEPESASAFGTAVSTLDYHVVLDRDELPRLVTDRLRQLDDTRPGQAWLWWSAGGVGVVLLVALAFAVWLWMQ